MKRILAFITLAATTLVAQQSNQQPAAEMPKLAESIDVKVINVDVVVTDRKGVPITGLTKDDFELFENGQPKLISNFYEVQGKKATNISIIPAGEEKPVATVPAEEMNETLRRRIIFYVDNLSLQPFNRNRVFKDMKEFAKNVMRPGDEAMVATFNRSMKIRANFTRDPIQIQQTLDVIAGESALGVANRSERRDVEKRIQDADNYSEAVAAARQYGQSVEHDLRQSVESLKGLMSTLAGVEGKKILVLTTEGFQIQPGREMFYLVDEISREKGWPAGGTMLEGMTFNSASTIQMLAKTANANGITMYTLHAGGLAAASDGGLAERDRPIPYAVTQAAVSNSTESLQVLAEMTGGLASINTNNFSGAFKNILRDLDSYYSLGYRAGTERVDRQRSLDVRIKGRRGYIVRSRQSFVEKSTFAEMSDRVIANLLYRSKANDLNVRVKINTPVPADDLFRVPVEIQIPMESLALLPQGESYLGGFTVYVAVANKDGDMSDVAQRQQQIRVPQADMAKIKGKYYTYVLDLLMERGVNRVSIGVVDDVSNVTGFDRQQVIAQDLR
ncbi:MAG: VWA domain-containing protein [Acidobacteriota bacterium]